MPCIPNFHTTTNAAHVSGCSNGCKCSSSIVSARSHLYHTFSDQSGKFCPFRKCICINFCSRRRMQLMCGLNLEISHSTAQLSPYFKASVGSPPQFPLTDSSNKRSHCFAPLSGLCPLLLNCDQWLQMMN